MRIYLPPDTINPLSGCTRAEELAKARFWGGRLPFDTYEDLIRRRIVPDPTKKITARNRRRQKGMYIYEN